ncbi:hypothetical protein [Sorangium sp. So ce117]|uniref:hypothetical protein n=1 Tax=Sorangium sp. So ce117 TaxID=3133277 RepID=UPI003F5DDE64
MTASAERSVSRTYLRQGDRLVATVDDDQIERLFDVAVGASAESSDHGFWVVERAHDIVTVPDDIAGFVPAVEAVWAERARRLGRFYRVFCAAPPLGWCRRYLFVPLLSIELQVLPRVELNVLLKHAMVVRTIE